MTIDIDIEAGAWNAIAHVEGLARRAAEAALPADEVRSLTLVLSSDDVQRGLNRQWRGKDSPTNVLSFPAPAMPVPVGEVAHLGDIVLAFETIDREARDQHKSLADHATHLIIHGILHLLGYDHETEAEAAVMEDRERMILARLGIADPYTE